MSDGAQPGIARIDIVPRDDGAMDEAVVARLDDALRRAAADPAVRVIILAGTMPGIFIRHYALDVLRDLGAAMRARGLHFDPARPTPETRLHAMLRWMGEIEQPIIAALNGTAMGGGFELALACDLRIGQSGPHLYGLPEINAGLFPGAGGTQKLGRLIGDAKALEFVLLGRTVSPEQAAALGLLTEVSDDACARAEEIARQIAASPRKAVAHIKRLMRRAPSEAALAAERTLFADILVDDDSFSLLDETVRAGRPIQDRPSGRKSP